MFIRPGRVSTALRSRSARPQRADLLVSAVVGYEVGFVSANFRPLDTRVSTPPARRPLAAAAAWAAAGLVAVTNGDAFGYAVRSRPAWEFLLDAQIPSNYTRRMQPRGVTAAYLAAVGFTGASDLAAPKPGCPGMSSDSDAASARSLGTRWRWRTSFKFHASCRPRTRLPTLCNRCANARPSTDPNPRGDRTRAPWPIDVLGP